jgi:basic membrane protein A
MTLARTERQYLDASINLRDELIAAEEERGSREAASKRRAKRNAFGLVGVIAAVILVGGYFLWTAIRPVPTVAWLHPGGPMGDIDAMSLTGFERAGQDFDIIALDVPIFADPMGQLRQLAEDGTDLIITSLDFPEAIDELAPDFRDTEFVVIDAGWAPDHPNVSRVEIDEADAAYLVGVAAAKASKTGAVGFLGGVQHGSLFNHWVSAFEAGVKDTDPSMTVTSSWIAGRFGTDTDEDTPFNDTDAAHAAAMHLYSQGVDVIFTAAGNSVYGAIQAARDYSVATGDQVLAIGADVDTALIIDADLQDFVLTSLEKRFDTILYKTIEVFLDGSAEPFTMYGIEDKAVGYSRSGDRINAMQADLEAVTADLEAGLIVLPEVSAVPTAWPEPADHHATATFDGGECTLSELGGVVEGDVVSFTFVNKTNRDAWVNFWEMPGGVSTQMYAEAFDESEDANETLWSFGGTHVTWWEIPSNETYEIRTTFLGTPMGTGVVVCGLGDSEPFRFAGSFDVLDP